MPVYTLPVYTVRAYKSGVNFSLLRKSYNMTYNTSTQTYDIVVRDQPVTITAGPDHVITAQPDAPQANVVTEIEDGPVSMFNNVPTFSRTYTFSDSSTFTATMYMGKDNALYSVSEQGQWMKTTDDSYTWSTVTVMQLPEPIRYL